MGWCSGTDYVDGVWELIKDLIPEEKKIEVAKGIVKVFEAGDWDCQMESEMVQEIMDLDDEFCFDMQSLDWCLDEEEIREQFRRGSEKAERMIEIWHQRRNQ